VNAPNGGQPPTAGPLSHRLAAAALLPLRVCRARSAARCTGAPAPDEHYLIDSTSPELQGLDGAVASFVEYLYAPG